MRRVGNRMNEYGVILTGKFEVLRKNLPQFHFVHHKFHTNWLESYVQDVLIFLHFESRSTS